jgi:hypothetical protein
MTIFFQLYPQTYTSVAISFDTYLHRYTLTTIFWKAKMRVFNYKIYNQAKKDAVFRRDF